MTRLENIAKSVFASALGALGAYAAYRTLLWLTSDNKQGSNTEQRRPYWVRADLAANPDGTPRIRRLSVGAELADGIIGQLHQDGRNYGLRARTASGIDAALNYDGQTVGLNLRTSSGFTHRAGYTPGKGLSYSGRYGKK